MVNKPPKRQAIAALNRARQTVKALQVHTAKQWLGTRYRSYLYGGWTRDDGTIAPPHRKAIALHGAAKAMFCPAGDEGDECWTYLGQIGELIEQHECPVCGWMGPSDRAGHYKTLFIGGGNQSSKSFTMMSEFCAWVRGRRPWDNSITCADREPGDWLLAGPSFSKHFPLTLNPYFEERMADVIIEKVKNQAKSTVMYTLDTGDRVHCLSYEQYLKAAGISPFEGARWKGAAFDEPPPRGVWVPTKRGLLKWMSRGFGKAIFGCTPLECPWLFHEIYQNAWNKGGSVREIFAIEFDITDNPALTTRAIATFSEGLSMEEKEARLHGRFMHLTGRIYPVFDEKIHVQSQADFDPLLDASGAPSNWPIVMTVDPHDRRPWVMGWYALSPKGDIWIVREWPDEPFERMKGRSRRGYDDYVHIMRQIEDVLPGGPARVLLRELDPNMGRRPTVAKYGDSIAETLMNYGFYFGTQVNDALTEGHARISTLLAWDTNQPLSEMNRPKLFCLESCRNHIFSFNNYIYDDWATGDLEKAPKEKPRDVGKDFMDCLRYAVMSEARWTDWRERRAWYGSQIWKRKLKAAARHRR